MPFIPHSKSDVSEMLAAIGSQSIEDLFDEIPASLRIDKLSGVPEGMIEQDIARLMMERAEADGRPLCFMGAGAYDHHIPAAVWELTTRGEFYSAYTPYQAESSLDRNDVAGTSHRRTLHGVDSDATDSHDDDGVAGANSSSTRCRTPTCRDST